MPVSKNKVMNYSQNNEEAIIKNFFGSNYVGALLSIGENDGITCSNALALIEAGWKAVLIEPAHSALERLRMLHAARKENVLIIDYAIDVVDGEKPFKESGELLMKGDTALVSTLVPKETERWAPLNMPYKTYRVKVATWKTFYEACPTKHFDFISIDAEGLDYEILRQIDLRETRTKLVCVEWNSKDFHLYNAVLLRQGFRFISKNAENLIYGR